jgi:hypothetical protein
MMSGTNGRLTIPAGTEIHGAAEVERERVASGNQFVLQSGRPLLSRRFTAS